MNEHRVTKPKKRRKLDDATRRRPQKPLTPFEEKVIDMAKKWWPDAKSFRITNHFPKFADGSMYYIWVTTVDNGKEEEDDMVAYVVGDEIKLCYDFQDLGNVVGPTRGILRTLVRVLELGGIAGIIAVTLTVTFSILICTGGTEGRTDLIDLMKNALLLILGFYFGSKVSK